ncbi:MAG: hypothetical protein IJ375_00460 [Oscillospiraceae bacterium]|nr:hypothetical protein [Oscillospiraceae bacterium]
MERIKNLDLYQKCILLLLIAMLILFTVLYCTASSRVGFEYKDSILIPSYEDDRTVYSGVVQGEQASIAVTAEHVVTFTCGDRSYGPFTAKEDPTAVPDDEDYMTGVEILEGDEVFFRGGVFGSGDDLVLFAEDGGITVSAVMSDGTVVDGDGNIVDQMAPSASEILRLLAGPELTSRGEWMAWFLGLFVSVITAVSILFADELFRWNMAFRIRDVDRAEPSDWELMG